MVAFVGHDAAIGLVNRRRKKRTGKEVDVSVGIDAIFAGQSDGLAERLEHRGDEEVTAELDHVCHLGLGADHEGTLTDRVENGLAAFKARSVSRGRDEKLGGCGSLGTSEDRGGNNVLPTLAMFSGKLL